MLKFAMFIALLALVGVVYGFATGFKDAANPEGTRATPALDGDAAQARRQRARRTMWGSAIVFILVALWYGFIYESPEDRAERIANKDIKTCTDILAAYNASQNFITNFIPGAQFPIIPKKEGSKVLRPCVFEIQGDVFENGTEGEAKKPFSAQLNFDPETERWNLEKLVVDGQSLLADEANPSTQ